MKIEAMAAYTHDFREISFENPAIISLQHQIVDLTERLKDMNASKPRCPQVWCTICHIEGYHATKYLRSRSARSSTTPLGPPLPHAGTYGGVAQVSTSISFKDIPSTMHFLINKVCLLTSIVKYVVLMSILLNFVPCFKNIKISLIICYVIFVVLPLIIQTNAES